MKRKLFISIVTLAVALSGAAQTNHYPNVSGTITKTGYTYNYRVPTLFGVEETSSIELYNSANPYLNTEWGYKSGYGEMPFAEKMGTSNVQDFTD
ncbi:MAG: hypothetical protein LBU95_03885, partial [Rikenellaceae bacterium]|nr:hypothetical protein [Rikenellaceae bacterium]